MYHRLDVSIERDFELENNLELNVKAGAINTYDRRNLFSMMYLQIDVQISYPWFHMWHLKLDRNKYAFKKIIISSSFV